MAILPLGAPSSAKLLLIHSAQLKSGLLVEKCSHPSACGGERNKYGLKWKICAAVSRCGNSHEVLHCKIAAAKGYVILAYFDVSGGDYQTNPKRVDNGKPPN